MEDMRSALCGAVRGLVIPRRMEIQRSGMLGFPQKGVLVKSLSSPVHSWQSSPAHEKNTSN